MINDFYCLPSSADFIIFIIICFFLYKISPTCRPVFVSSRLIVSASWLEITQNVRIYVGNTFLLRYKEMVQFRVLHIDVEVRTEELLAPAFLCLQEPAFFKKRLKRLSGIEILPPLPPPFMD